MSLQKSLANFWAARAARERRVLLGGGILLALLLLYLTLVAPAASAVANLQRLLPQTRARAARLESLVTEAKALRKLPQVAAPGPSQMRAALDRSLDAAGLKAARAEALPNGDLHITFVDVPFGKWTAWLANSERTMGVRTVAASIKAGAGAAVGSAGSAGNADIELTLRPLRVG